MSKRHLVFTSVLAGAIACGIIGAAPASAKPGHPKPPTISNPLDKDVSSVTTGKLRDRVPHGLGKNKPNYPSSSGSPVLGRDDKYNGGDDDLPAQSVVEDHYHFSVVPGSRVKLEDLIATNFLGMNTPAIMTTEAQYEAMWAQDVAAMVGYHAGRSAR